MQNILIKKVFLLVYLQNHQEKLWQKNLQRNLNKVSKKKIVITGAKGLLGAYFYKKYKKQYKIIKYPNRIEHFSKFQKWLKDKNFSYFIHFAALTKGESIKRRKSLNLINVKSTLNLIKSINKKRIRDFKYFLFISSSHVYGSSRKKIKENQKTIPNNSYGLSMLLAQNRNQGILYQILKKK